MKKYFVVLAATLGAALGASHDARAQCCPSSGLPSVSGTCSVAGACFETSSSNVSGIGVTGTNSASGTGVVGNSSSPTGGSSSIGVEGLSSATSGEGIGVVGITAASAGYGMVGANGTLSFSGGTGAGVLGITAQSGASGVYGAGGSGVFANGVAGVSSSSSASGVIGTNTSGGFGVVGSNGGSNTSGYAGSFNGRVQITGNLTVSGTCNGGPCSSDLRLKKNVQSLSGSLDDLVKLRPVTFEWRNPEERGYSSGKQFGLIAQEVEKVKPEWVAMDDKGFRTVNTAPLQIMLLDGVRTLKMENDALRARETDLEGRVSALEANRRPMISGVGEGGIGLGLLAVAGAVIASRRKRLESGSLGA